MKIVDFEIYPIKDAGETASIAERDEDADYFSLFGRIDGDVNDFYVCVGDFESRGAAEMTRNFLDDKKQGLPQEL